MMRSARLLAPRAFEKPAKGETKFCANCLSTIHVHVVVECRECAGKYRACKMGMYHEGFVSCIEHGGTK